MSDQLEQPINEIEQEHPPEWLVIRITRRDGFRLSAGVLVYHGPDLAEAASHLTVENAPYLLARGKGQHQPDVRHTVLEL